MKRRTLKFMACAAVMALTLSVTACGGGSGDTVEDSDKAAVETEAEEKAADAVEDAVKDAEAEAAAEAEAEATAEADAEASEGETLEDYFSDPSIKSVFESQLESMGGDGLSIDYEVKGNEFIMEFTFAEGTELPENAGDMLATELDNQASSFEQQVSSFDEAIGEAGACTATVRYYAPDGTLLAEKSFKAQ